MKTKFTKSLKKKIQQKIQDSKDLIQESKDILQDRIQHIRRSYPYHNTDALPGLSVSLLSGDPADLYSSKDTNFNNKSVIDDVSKLALL